MDNDEIESEYVECGVCAARVPYTNETPAGWRYAQVTEICQLLVCSENCQRRAETGDD